MLLWNMRMGFEHAGLDFWLSSIICHCPDTPVIVVGTQLDQVKFRAIISSLEYLFHFLDSLTRGPC